jgi:hypothetical protein
MNQLEATEEESDLVAPRSRIWKWQVGSTIKSTSKVRLTYKGIDQQDLF